MKGLKYFWGQAPCSKHSAGFEWKKDRGGKERRVPFRVHLRNTCACVERKEWEEVQSPRLVLNGEPARTKRGAEVIS